MFHRAQRDGTGRISQSTTSVYEVYIAFYCVSGRSDFIRNSRKYKYWVKAN